jgi:hypothetical protein
MKKKFVILLGVLFLYILIGSVVFSLASSGFITKLVKEPKIVQRMDYDFDDSEIDAVKSLEAAKNFVNNELREENGHINLYVNFTDSYKEEYGFTNSEAVSYYLLWNVQDLNKVDFDEELDFIEENMVHPEAGFLMWKLDSNDEVIDDGANVATDADLRMLRALFLAREVWGDERYDRLISEFSGDIEGVAITGDNHFAPYGGFRDGEIWKTEEVWLSYSDFNAFAFLSEERGELWRDVYYTTKDSTLKAQDENGLYFTQLEENRVFSSRLDNDRYSINTLWIMATNAESNDDELRDSAKTALQFYKDKYEEDGMIFSDYNKDGSAGSGGDSPWVYALVGRVAVMLEDEEFSDFMISELIKKQDLDEGSPSYGAFLEGGEGDKRAGQFTIQESIITLQQYVAMKSSLNRQKS